MTSSLHILGLYGSSPPRRPARPPGAPHDAGHGAAGGVLPDLLLGHVQVLQQQLVDLRRQGLLEDAQEAVGLAAHSHGQRQVLHTVLGTGKYRLILKNV